MLDFLMLTTVAAAFLGAFGYVRACQGITGRRSPAWDNSP
jgi:hypothetical protein